MSNITMTNTDPGEGSPLSADNYLAVYGGRSLLDIFYPVGTYYETSDANFDPNVSWGGIWEEDSYGRVTVAYQSNNTPFNEVGKIGGEQEHTLTEQELPVIDGEIAMHSNNQGTNIHNVTGHFTANRTNVNAYKSGGETASGADSKGSIHYKFGGGKAHNILQPYIVVKRWHRVS